VIDVADRPDVHVWDPMTRETKLLHLREPATLGDSIDGWRVFWLGGWDRGGLFFIVMVEKIVR
jgi:hypothetical protein